MLNTPLINAKWTSLLNDFSSYQGTITAFCKENNISKSQLYYYRKKLERAGEGIFQAITLKEKTECKLISRVSNNILIEISNVKIHVPANEITALSTIIKELSKSV